MPPQFPFTTSALEPSALGRDLYQARRRTYTRTRGFYGGVYGGGYGYGTSYAAEQYPSSPQAPPAPATGYLRLDVDPDTAQVFIDGLYAGEVSDFRRGGRPIGAGPHRVEIRADGFDGITFDVGVPSDDMVSYRRTLSRMEQKIAAAGLKKTIYVVPRCFAGDVRPTQDQLPKGCTLKNLRVVPAVIAAPAR
jgi:hypothetical protein